MELEAFLCSKERPVSPKFPCQGTTAESTWTRKIKKSLEELKSTVGTPIGSGRSLERIQPSEMAEKSCNVIDAIGMLEKEDAATLDPMKKKSFVKRLTAELRNLERGPHPYFDVFPCESNLGFWKVVVTAPDDDICAYRNGTWLLSLLFPKDFPSVAPVVRFETPIVHANVNTSGRICHAILGRDWSPTTTVREVFDNVFGLLLSPDFEHALNANLVMTLHNDPVEYREAVKPKGAAVQKKREAWAVELG